MNDPLTIRSEAIDPWQVECDALIIPLAQADDVPSLPAELPDQIREACHRLLREARFDSSAGRVIVVPTLGSMPARRLVVVGVGSPSEPTAESMRMAWGRAVSACREAGAREIVSCMPPALSEVQRDALLEAAVQGAWLASYRFDRYRSRSSQTVGSEDGPVLTFASAAGDTNRSIGAIERGQAIARAVGLARDLTNEPAATLTPVALADRAREVAEAHGLEITIYDEEGLAELGAAPTLAVGAGSAHPPRMIHLTYRPAVPPDSPRTVALVGKGITFDSGGYSIKSTEGMQAMKGDMAGGAAVLGVMSALRALDVPVTVHGVICAAENMISEQAFRPGDILTGMNGVTMEIISTDAEGRLVLADGLVYASRQGVDLLIDIATLTGAKVVALGNETIALFANDDILARQLLEAAEVAGEPTWRLPLAEHLESSIASDIADIKNSGGRAGGAIAGALFLQHFVDGIPWAHLDIAGANRTTTATAYTPKGATGVAVRTLIEFLRQPTRQGADDA